jgi:hypothetical protein
MRITRFSLLTVLVASATAQSQFVVRTPLGLANVTFVAATAADLDGDGDLDVIGWTSSPAPFGVRYLRNDGFEVFTDVTATHVPPLPAVAATSVARSVAFDADQDGDLDVMLSSYWTSSLLRNLGNGTFVDATSALGSPSGGYLDLIAADVDHDGDTDVFAIGALLVNIPRFFLNNGSGVFTPFTPVLGPVVRAAAVADLDGDGRVELLLADLTLRVLTHTATGFVDISSSWVPAALGQNPFEVEAGDLDGDGRVDVVASFFQPAVTIVLRNTGTILAPIATLPPTPTGPQAIELFDCDRDGDRDLLRAGNGFFELFRNDGTGAMTPIPMPATTAQQPLPEPADLDGDGDVDVLVATLVGPTSALWRNRHRDLVALPPQPGGSLTIEVACEPGYANAPRAYVFAVALLPLLQPVALPPFGLLAIDVTGPGFPVFGVVPTATGVAATTFTVPPSAGLGGLTLYLQALVEHPQGLALSNAVRVVLP